MLVTCACAYALSRKNMHYRGAIAFFIYFTMLFSGGLVPTYLWVTRYLHLSDSLWSLILPSLVNAWNLLLMRNFFNGIPEALSESASIDGANDIKYCFQLSFLYRFRVLQRSDCSMHLHTGMSGIKHFFTYIQIGNTLYNTLLCRYRKIFSMFSKTQLKPEL